MIFSDKTQPMVSVLIATYNQEEYIAQTLDSILMQQCSFDFEIIIGEDCSTDKTREICFDYQKRYPEKIVLCLNETNKGLLDNYFDIFLKTRGKYIADCGGDDYWVSTNKLQEQVDLLENHPELSLVASNWSMYIMQDGLLVDAPGQIKEDWYKPDLYGKKAVISYLNEAVIPRVVLSTSCFRRDLAMEAYLARPELFRSKKATCEDLPLTLCLLMKGPFYFKADNWLVYRVLNNSVSHSENRNEYVSGFAYNTFKQTVCLANDLDIKYIDISAYIDKWIANFTLHAFIVSDVKLMRDIRHFTQIQGISLKKKQILLSFMMAVPGLYGFSRWLYLSLKKSINNSAL